MAASSPSLFEKGSGGRIFSTCPSGPDALIGRRASPWKDILTRLRA